MRAQTPGSQGCSSCSEWVCGLLATCTRASGPNREPSTGPSPVPSPLTLSNAFLRPYRVNLKCACDGTETPVWQRLAAVHQKYVAGTCFSPARVCVGAGSNTGLPGLQQLQFSPAIRPKTRECMLVLVTLLTPCPACTPSISIQSVYRGMCTLQDVPQSPSNLPVISLHVPQHPRPAPGLLQPTFTAVPAETCSLLRLRLAAQGWFHSPWPWVCRPTRRRRPR